MHQIFAPSADAWLRLFVAGGLALAGGSMVGLIGFARSDLYTGARINPPAQPVPFSHKHHVGGLGLDCAYCHTSFAQSARAGMPPTHTCMTCHSQIWTNAPMLAPVRQSLAEDRPLVWQRVARLPDYVYFRHDIHIAKGVGCVSCHGRVDHMPLMFQAKPLTMQFCLSCHRDPAPKLRPREHVTDMDWKQPENPRAAGAKLVQEYGIRLGQITDCYVCHR